MSKTALEIAGRRDGWWRASSSKLLPTDWARVSSAAITRTWSGLSKISKKLSNVPEETTIFIPTLLRQMAFKTTGTVEMGSAEATMPPASG
ncbi:hypothetical protein RRF57_005142 [Xylaria bambusicola]|uniref:Uncharacterized protein n=1 Tax=Xylaria bambusicola TaxID=326684 RepID=A0AAN7UJB2_9PEZI